MKAYGQVILLCLSLFLISNSEVQATPTNKALSIKSSQLLEKEFYKTGNTFFDQGNYSEAITYYDKALVLNATDVAALYNKALALDSLGESDKALTFYDKVLSITPNDTDTLNNKGVLLDSLDQHDKAINLYDKVLKINPEDSDALYNKGLALENLGNKTQAMSYYKKVLEVNPGDAAASAKLNLTFNNPTSTTQTVGEKTDNTFLTVVVGLFVVLLIGIVIIDQVNKIKKKSKLKELTPQVFLKPEGLTSTSNVKLEHEDPTLTSDVKPQQSNDYVKLIQWVDEIKAKKTQQQKSTMLL